MSSVLFDVPGPKARTRHRLVAAVGGIVVLGALAWVLTKFAEKDNLEASKWAPFLTWEIWNSYFIPGLIGTLKAAAISIFLAGALGLLLGIGRMSPIRALSWLSTAFIELFRAVPVLVMMFFSFYLYTTKGVFPDEINPLAAVVTALTIYNGSVVAELIRSGVGSLPSGQAEGGLSIGLTPFQTLRLIQLPQAITAMLPAIVGQLVVVLKDSALGNIILYPELLTTYSQIGSYKSNPVPALMVIAVIYIVINYLLTVLAGRVERRLRAKGRPTIGRGAAGGGALPPPAGAVVPAETAAPVGA